MRRCARSSSISDSQQQGLWELEKVQLHCIFSNQSELELHHSYITVMKKVQLHCIFQSRCELTRDGHAGESRVCQQAHKAEQETKGEREK